MGGGRSCAGGSGCGGVCGGSVGVGGGVLVVLREDAVGKVCDTRGIRATPVTCRLKLLPWDTACSRGACAQRLTVWPFLDITRQYLQRLTVRPFLDTTQQHFTQLRAQW
jgi:hypothetical protein